MLGSGAMSDPLLHTRSFYTDHTTVSSAAAASAEPRTPKPPQRKDLPAAILDAAVEEWLASNKLAK